MGIIGLDRGIGCVARSFLPLDKYLKTLAPHSSIDVGYARAGFQLPRLDVHAGVILFEVSASRSVSNLIAESFSAAISPHGVKDPVIAKT